jgi:hypothetical protein
MDFFVHSKNADMAQTRRNARLIEDRGRDAADWLG